MRDAALVLGELYRRQTGLDLRVRSGRRTCAEQDGLYAQGRTAPGAIVTQARGCLSWHVLGRAIDADPVQPGTGTLTGRQSDYEAAGALWRELGGVWGGGFPGFPDVGHFEFHPGQKIESVCPDPSDCTQIQVDTVGPPIWPWIAVGAALAGAGAWVLSR